VLFLRFVLAFSTGVVIIGSALVGMYSRAKGVFDVAAIYVNKDFEGRINSIRAAQNSLKAFFDASHEVESGEFGLFCRRVRENWPFLQGMAYYPETSASGPVSHPSMAFPDSGGWPAEVSPKAFDFENDYAFYDDGTGTIFFLSRVSGLAVIALRMQGPDIVPSKVRQSPLTVTVSLIRKESAVRGAFLRVLDEEPPKGLPSLVLRRNEEYTAFEREWVVSSSGVYMPVFEDFLFLVAASFFGALFVWIGLLMLRREKDLEQREDILQRSQRMDTASSMARGLGHDFNNVLMGLSGTMELLRDMTAGRPEIECKRLEPSLTIMDSAVKRASEILDQLKQVGRPPEPVNEPFSLTEALKAVAALSSYTVDPAVSVEVDDHQGEAVCAGDRSQIERCFLNLVINSAHAMTIMLPEGKPRGGVVKIALSRSDSTGRGGRSEGRRPYWKVSVSDSGVGMDRSTRLKIFTPYFTTKKAGKGTGLGLSVCYGIVQGHGGYITVESKPGRGSTFSVFLPCAPT
jgi:signal transduction histidine kinase